MCALMRGIEFTLKIGTVDIRLKNMPDSIFFNQLFVSERKQIALLADEKSPSRISRRLFATSRSEMGIRLK